MSAADAADLVGHVALAVGLQLLSVRLTKSWWGGALVAIAWVVSRELTQAEYRWIETFGAGRRANMPWWGGLDPAVWPKTDQWLDWIGPSLVVLAVAWLMTRRVSR